MTTMSETELERLGITAKGARTKMLKSIQGLRQRNVEAEHTIGAFNQQLQSGVYASTIKGLSDMLHPDEALFMDGPMPEKFNMLSEVMSGHASVIDQHPWCRRHCLLTLALVLSSCRLLIIFLLLTSQSFAVCSL